jgi:hypothetical protein
MKYKVTGTIEKIGERKELSNGATVLDYVVKNVSENGWETPFKIEMYSKQERIEHLDNFLKFNKVGDAVEVEFDIKGREYEGKVYNSLSHWSCRTLEDTVPTAQEEDKDLLPF